MITTEGTENTEKKAIRLLNNDDTVKTLLLLS